jgi:hypothetical protein
MYQSNWKVHKPNASRDGEWMMLTVFQLDEKFLKFLNWTRSVLPTRVSNYKNEKCLFNCSIYFSIFIDRNYLKGTMHIFEILN